MKYQAELHTPDTLTSQIAAIYSQAPDTVLLGSLGRAVIFDRLLSNPNAEFEARGQVPERKLEDGQVVARDIDIISANAQLRGSKDPFLVEFPFDDRLLSLRREGEDWCLVSERREVYEPLHPAVMEPIEGESVYGASVITVPVQTHLAVFGLLGALRPKDENNLRFLERAAERNKTKLPEELYEPFDRMRVLANTGWFHNTRQIYRMVVPYRLRKKLVPATALVKERLL